MTDLPPAERLAKLRALEEWLAWQLDQTRRKIKDIEQQVHKQAGYVVEKEITKGHPLGATVHLADCTMAQRETRPVSEDEARFALTKDKGFFTSCEFCAPEKTLGLAG
jgi:hypothetical protein